MKYCPNCGAELESDDKNYCSNCGFNLRTKEDSNQNETNTDEKKKIDLKNKNGDSLNNPKSSDKGQQKSKKWILYIVLAIASVIAIIAIYYLLTGPRAKSISLSRNNLEIAVGDTVQLNYTIDPENTKNKDIIWKSSDETIVSVSNGEIKGLKEGNCIITVQTANGKEDTCKVTVKEWKISHVVVNTDEEDSETDLDAIPADSTHIIYFHWTITDGPADSSLKITVKSKDSTYNMVDEARDEKEEVYDGEWSVGDELWFSWQKYDVLTGADRNFGRGSITMKIYEAKTDEYLGGRTINVE